MDNVECKNCSKMGHFGHECTEPRNMAKVQCRNCDEFGHTGRGCPNLVPRRVLQLQREEPLVEADLFVHFMALDLFAHFQWERPVRPLPSRATSSSTSLRASWPGYRLSLASVPFTVGESRHRTIHSSSRVFRKALLKVRIGRFDCQHHSASSPPVSGSWHNG
jgi:hypothetical protein